MHIVLLSLLHFVQQLGGMLSLRSRGFFAQTVQCLVARGRDEPADRRWRNAGSRPLSQRDCEGFLHRFLGERNVAEEAGEHGHATSVFAPKYCVDRCVQLVCSTNGRTSMGVVVARANFRAHSSAASRSGTRTMVIPPICSLLSMNGPSVSKMSPFWWRRTVAELEAWSPPLKTHTSADCISLCNAFTSLIILFRAAGGG